MKKKIFTAVKGLLAIGLLLQLSSCHKFKDWFPHIGNGDSKLCQIHHITTYEGSDTLLYDFSYNHKGDPVSLISNKTILGLYNLRFLYDHHHRLTAYYAESPYPGPSSDFVYLHNFTYDHMNRITIDSTFLTGTFEAVEDGLQHPIQVVYFEYDNYGRISKAREVNLPGDPAEYENIVYYTYDANGNLENGSTYDNKVNMARTNKIWMFIRRDYSRNNPYTAVNYNAYGLPVELNEMSNAYTIFVYPVYYGRTKIDYTCNIHGHD